MSDGDFVIAGRTQLLRAHVFAVSDYEVHGPDGTFHRAVAEHPGAVFIVAVDHDGKFGMIRQWRAARNGWQWELAAGTRDIDGEPELETAKRELREELGVSAGEWRELTWLYSSPGWTDQVNRIFVATDLRLESRGVSGPEETHSSVGWLSPREVRDLIQGGGLDAVSTAALLMVFAGDLSE
jgi:ADP-ribose pyrophosphatase